MAGSKTELEFAKVSRQFCFSVIKARAEASIFHHRYERSVRWTWQMMQAACGCCKDINFRLGNLSPKCLMGQHVVHWREELHLQNLRMILLTNDAYVDLCSWYDFRRSFIDFSKDVLEALMPIDGFEA
jgi:hypothetical protein